MEKALKVWKFISGKKTYAVGALLIILGLLQKDNQLILEGIGLMTLRSGVAGIKK